MSDQNMKDPSKSASKPQNYQRNQSADAHRSGPVSMPSGKTPKVERMETFPKTNTFPKKWDLSSFTKS